MLSIPCFGVCKPGVNYVERPGAYAFIVNTLGELAVVQTSYGYYLPGGGLDPGEDELTGLKREIDEEIGYELLTADLVTRASQYHWSDHYGEHFKKVGAFFECTARAPATPRFQFEHDLVWWPAPKAERQLNQEFQRWAVGQRG